MIGEANYSPPLPGVKYRARASFPLSPLLGDDGAAGTEGAALNKKIQYEKEWDIGRREGIAEPRRSLP